MNMDNSHRYFVQYMLKQGVSTIENAIQFCKYVSKDQISSNEQFKTLVAEINRKIGKHSFRLVFDICEVTNEEIIVWINTKSDEISNLQVAFNALELEYFHAILQEILNSDEHRITFIVCLNITSSLTGNLSRSNGQKVLEKWIKVGYYLRNDCHIYLGARLILEFNAYLKSHCPESMCNLCSELVFTGKQCSECKKMLHSTCLSKYLERQNNCPCCQSEWVELERTATEHANGLNNFVENHMETMEATEEVPEDVFEDYSQLTEEYANTIPDCSQNNKKARTNFGRLRTRRTTEEDLLEAGPSTRN